MGKAIAETGAGPTAPAVRAVPGVRAVPTIRAVMFDFYGTLARAADWGRTIEEVLHLHGLAVPDGARPPGLADGLDHSEHSVDRDAYLGWQRTRFRGLAEACGATGPVLDAVSTELFEANASYRLEAYPEAAEVLAELRRRGVGTSVCSNWNWDLDRDLEAVGLAPLLEHVVTSARAGCRKPHPRIFASALATCGTNAEETLFVGDTFECDVAGPMSAGMPALHVWRTEERHGQSPPPLPPGASRAEDLRGVLRLL
ncbi:MAG: HAD family hydrolase [Acidimicrobiales bacterium]